MKKLTWLTAAVAMFLVQSAASQRLAAPAPDRPSEPNMVFDDDGGKAQIVPADFSVAGPKKFHGGAVMAAVRQVSIFLGSGWADTSVRIRQTALGDLAADNTGPHIAELQKHGIKILPAAPHAEDFGDLSKTPLNDLDIQRKLNDMLRSHAIPAPAANTVYVVFLAPEITSTLGGNKAGVDYVAYHNFVNLEAGEVRYVVVPFHQNTGRHQAAATRAFAEAALNPNGRGWF